MHRDRLVFWKNALHECLVCDTGLCECEGTEGEDPGGREPGHPESPPSRFPAAVRTVLSQPGAGQVISHPEALKAEGLEGGSWDVAAH